MHLPLKMDEQEIGGTYAFARGSARLSLGPRDDVARAADDILDFFCHGRVLPWAAGLTLERIAYVDVPKNCAHGYEVMQAGIFAVLNRHRLDERGELRVLLTLVIVLAWTSMAAEERLFHEAMHSLEFLVRFLERGGGPIGPYVDVAGADTPRIQRARSARTPLLEQVTADGCIRFTPARKLVPCPGGSA